MNDIPADWYDEPAEHEPGFIPEWMRAEPADLRDFPCIGPEVEAMTDEPAWYIDVDLVDCPWCGPDGMPIQDASGVKCTRCYAKGPYPGPGEKPALLWNAMASSWQPIESAPKDGTWVLVIGLSYDGSGKYWKCPSVAYWHEGMLPFCITRKVDGVQGWIDVGAMYALIGRDHDEDDLLLVNVTHWMPMPPPPVN